MRMNKAIIERLTRLTDEEREILQGKKLNRDRYFVSDRFVVNSAKILENRELDLRPHTRFIDFPEHGHDYMEFMYVYSGKITHVIGTATITLEQGDILFLNRHARHSIKMAGEEDVGINFILSNPFLKVVFHQIRNNPVMSEFLTNNFEETGVEEYLFFRTKDNFPIRNLMDNLIYAIVNHSQEVYSGLVSLLFTYLAYYRDTLVNSQRHSSPEAILRREVLDYLDQHYPNATLTELAKNLGYNPAYLSRRIRNVTGKTFQRLLQSQRLKIAKKLLCATSLSIEEIIHSVGYENQSHFYRVFLKTCGVTPHEYRKAPTTNPVGM